MQLHDMGDCLVVGRVPLTDKKPAHQRETREEAVSKRAGSKAIFIAVLSAISKETVRRSEHK